MLKIFNTLTREKEVFKPIHEGKVGMYVCGVTVYDLCHIGHGRTFVCFDVIARYLRSLGYDLTYVRNITDVDDKIIKRALENKETCDQLVDRMVQEMYKDFDALNVLRPDFEPRATHHIPEIIEIVEKLIARGHAYVADNGESCLTWKALKNTANYRAKISTSYKRVHVLKLMKSRKIQWISCFGKCQKKTNQAGHHHGAQVVQVGTLNVQQ